MLSLLVHILNTISFIAFLTIIIILCLTHDTYQLTKPSRNGSFLSSRMKHLSIPVNQLLKLAEAQKAMAMAMDNEEAATAFKFPLVNH